MKSYLPILFAVLMVFPIRLVALAEDTSKILPDATVQTSMHQQAIPYKSTDDAKVSFVRVLGVFLLMIVLAYAGIRSLKFFQSDALIRRGKSPLVKVLESRKLDTRTSIHVISVESERFIVTQNGHGLLVTRLESGGRSDGNAVQDV